MLIMKTLGLILHGTTMISSTMTVTTSSLDSSGEAIVKLERANKPLATDEKRILDIPNKRNSQERR
jgi:hypothetical protein